MKKIILMSLLCCLSATAQSFISVKGTHFVRDGKPYRYIGANYWYGALLASENYGDRKRLKRELDALKSSGIDNLRILVGADGGKYDFTVPYALQPEQGKYDDSVFDGLDFLLAEMGKRKMVAVLYLTNNWEWSGGMSQYLEWNGYGEIPNPNTKPENTWPKFMDYVSRFHSCEPCKASLDKHIRHVIGRTNKYTKKKYVDDPAIMAWQVANEPRIFKESNEEAFTDWLNKTVNLIDSLDKNHLICTGSEGKAGSNDDLAAFERTHANPNIDYLTMHIWPKNWSWYDYKKESETLPVAVEKADTYIDEHIAVAGRLGRPIVIEEFGLPRRGESLMNGSDIGARNAFYTHLFERLAQSVTHNQSLQGLNFWGYSGEGKTVNAGGKWEKGDPFTADPPQEPQGLNSVFSTDASTLEIIKKYIGLINRK